MVGINPQDNSNSVSRHQEMYLKKLGNKEALKKDPKIEKEKGTTTAKNEVQEKSTTFEDLYKEISNKSANNNDKETIDLSLFNIKIKTKDNKHSR